MFDREVNMSNRMLDSLEPQMLHELPEYRPWIEDLRKELMYDGTCGSSRDLG
jgi:hypothetical protein